MDEKRPVDERKIKFRPNLLGTKNNSKKWVVMVFLLSFILSASMMVASSKIMEGVNVYIALLVLLIIIVINILFDTVGTAVTAAEEAPFHAMASRKLYGARQALRLIRNADKVSNFCNDVIGDICGVISGSASALIVIKLARSEDAGIIEFILTGLVASLTVGGKSIGKTVAIKHSNYIVYKVSVILKFLFGRISFKRLLGGKSRKRKR
jgi:hypothetical protein